MSGSRECAKDWSDSLIKVIDSINNTFLSAFLKQDYDHKFADFVDFVDFADFTAFTAFTAFWGCYFYWTPLGVE